MTLTTVHDVYDKIVGHYYKKDPERLRKKGNVGNNTWAYDRDGIAVVKYHNTEIVAAVADDPETITPTLWLDHGGYMTPTTSQRMRWFLPTGVQIVGRNGSGFPDRWREGNWSLQLWRPVVPACFPFYEALGLHLDDDGMWRLWNHVEPYEQRAYQLRRQAIAWARRYQPSMLENSSALHDTWCADCTSNWPLSPPTNHFIEAHWQLNSRRLYNRRQVFAALSRTGIEAAYLDWIDPRIVRRALSALVPDTETLITYLKVADQRYPEQILRRQRA